MVTTISKENLQEVLGVGKPAVIDFWAPWCGPCRMIGPIIDELAAAYEGRVIIGKCNIDENNAVAVEYGVRSIPTILFFKDGALVDRHVGAAPRPLFEEKIKRLL